MDNDIKDDIKAIRTDIGDIKISVATNTAHLATHMQRTLLNEARIEKIEYAVLGMLASLVIGLLVKGHL